MSRRSTHTTRKEAEHIRRACRPPSSSLSIERSERFPDCLLEIPLATPWPKQTLRLATRTYSPHNNYLPTPRMFQPIYYSCVCAITSTALYPASFTQPHSHRRPSPCGPGHSHPYPHVGQLPAAEKNQEGSRKRDDHSTTPGHYGSMEQHPASKAKHEDEQRRPASR